MPVTRVEVTRCGPVLIARMIGFYTWESALLARDRVNRALDERQAGKVLLDLRACVSLLSDAEWAALYAELAANPIRASMGILVNEGALSECWSRCRAAIRGGPIRLPFAEPEHAASWAAIPLTALAPFRVFQPTSAAG